MRKPGRFERQAMGALGREFVESDEISPAVQLGRVTAPIESALQETFSNRQSVVPSIDSLPQNKTGGVGFERDIAINRAILNSDIYPTLPKYWPPWQTEEDHWKLYHNNDLSDSQQLAVVALVHGSLEERLFRRLKCKSEAAKAFKLKLERGEAPPLPAIGAVPPPPSPAFAPPPAISPPAAPPRQSIFARLLKLFKG